MNKSLIDQINFYYSKNENQKFSEFKSENKESLVTSQYMLYYKKCEDIINSLEAKNIDSNLNKLKSTIMEMTTKLNDTIHLIKDVQLSPGTNSTNNINESDDNEFTSNYIKESDKILNCITENLNKLKQSTYSSEYEKLSNAKKINNSKKNELKLQQLKNTLTENLKTLGYSMKEKNSKLLSIENKKNTLNDNKLKIEKLKEEYNLNSERMTIEIAENEKCQTKLDMVSHELNELKKNLNNDERREQDVKDEEIKLNKMIKDNALIMNELNCKKNVVEQDLGRKRKEIFGLLFVNYLYMNKISKINFVNDYYFTLKQICANLKDLTTKLGIKNAKIQEDKNKFDKKFIKYQLFIQEAKDNNNF